jgi:hypothetical protein
MWEMFESIAVKWDVGEDLEGGIKGEERVVLKRGHDDRRNGNL